MNVAGHCWSRRLACATLGGGCKHSWPMFSLTLFLAQVALCAPLEVAFAIRSWPLLLPIFALSLFLSLSLSLFSPSFAFDPLWGNSQGLTFVSPNILASLEDIDLYTQPTYYIAFFLGSVIFRGKDPSTDHSCN